MGGEVCFYVVDVIKYIFEILNINAIHSNPFHTLISGSS